MNNHKFNIKIILIFKILNLKGWQVQGSFQISRDKKYYTTNGIQGKPQTIKQKLFFNEVFLQVRLLKLDYLIMIGDSEIIIKLVHSVTPPKDIALAKWIDMINYDIKNFNSISLFCVFRHQNQKEDERENNAPRSNDGSPIKNGAISLSYIP